MAMPNQSTLHSIICAQLLRMKEQVTQQLLDISCHCPHAPECQQNVGAIMQHFYVSMMDYVTLTFGGTQEGAVENGEEERKEESLAEISLSNESPTSKSNEPEINHVQLINEQSSNSPENSNQLTQQPIKWSFVLSMKDIEEALQFYSTQTAHQCAVNQDATQSGQALPTAANLSQSTAPNETRVGPRLEVLQCKAPIPPNVKRFHCLQANCDKSYVNRVDYIAHLMKHRGLKPFHCKWPSCGYTSIRMAGARRHVRHVHFGIPQSGPKEKLLLMDIDTIKRNPKDFIEVVNEDM